MDGGRERASSLRKPKPLCPGGEEKRLPVEKIVEKSEHSSRKQLDGLPGNRTNDNPSVLHGEKGGGRGGQRSPDEGDVVGNVVRQKKRLGRATRRLRYYQGGKPRKRSGRVERWELAFRCQEKGGRRREDNNSRKKHLKRRRGKKVGVLTIPYNYSKVKISAPL